MPTPNEFALIIRAQDEATAEFAKIDRGAKQMGDDVAGALDGATAAGRRHGVELSKTTQLIREDRAEQRLRNFAIREGAAGIGQMAEAIGGPSGLNKTIQSGASTLFEMDFAIKAAGTAAESLGGTFGTIGGALGAMAGPLAVGIGAFVLLKQAQDDLHAETVKIVADIGKLNVELGKIAADPLGDMQSKVQEARNSFDDFADHSVLSWRRVLDGVVGSFGGSSTFATDMAVNLTLAVTKAALELEALEKKLQTEADARYSQTAILRAQNDKAYYDAHQKSEEKRIESDYRNELTILAHRESLALQGKQKGTGEYNDTRANFAEQARALEIERDKRVQTLKESNEKALQQLYQETSKVQIEADKTWMLSAVDDAKTKVEIERWASGAILDIDEARAVKEAKSARKTADEISAIHTLYNAKRILSDQEYNSKASEIDAKTVQDNDRKHKEALDALATYEIELDADTKGKELAALNTWLSKQREVILADALMTEAQKKAALDQLGKVGSQRRAGINMTDEQKQLQEIQKQWERLGQFEVNVTRTAADSFGSGVDTMVSDMISGSTNIGDAFHAMALRVLDDIAAMIVKTLIFKAISGIFTGGLSTIAGVPGMDMVGAVGGNLASAGGRSGIPPLQLTSMPTSGPQRAISVTINAMNSKDVERAFNSPSMRKALASAVGKNVRAGK